jgi:hypothetical protein
MELIDVIVVRNILNTLALALLDPGGASVVGKCAQSEIG